MRLSGMAISLFVVVVASILQRAVASGSNSTNTNETVSTAENQDVGSIPVPFLFMESPNWRDLSAMMEKYRHDSSVLLRGLSQSLEVALHSEREMGIEPDIQVVGTGTTNTADKTANFLLSKRLKHRLDRVAACLHHNEKELNSLMQEFPVRLALPTTHQPSSSNDERNQPKRNLFPESQQSTADSSHLFTLPHTFPGTTAADPSKKNAYDCGGQVIAHIVRDWTLLGQPVRASIYDWCSEMVEKHHKPGTSTSSSLPILVPGAGLGRLAHDLASSGYSVEANEVSLSMAAAARAILEDKRHGSFYPFALDSWANEVESERHYDRVQYPDTTILNFKPNGSLSYTLGDFVDVYHWQRPSASFGCVVTCFFIDTATNVYEYISTIEHALSSGGYWINIGPLRWHHNSVLHPAADELRLLLESSMFAFEVLHWSVDEQPSEYRHEDREYDKGKPFVRSTAYDGYRPLRFVVRRL
ncbi:Carnosine N-methyltransferase [Seminavis robusta]|uniref:carnosine N-methyltransferase n=1 Tax=Seminavis robusta TaxID=568900 RepID=A0A9N8DUL2_9STRA|nr:Carnosine N-methyltransferase [Seminavis robusta]|eukprot:Sro287_g108710.1 Carnosine N-methyltransferase (472) ;mRNA; r:77079-78494